ncbi:hypothetical protein C8J56DRAFT_243765 [Mycena floridula]|nr:hypothetical protein C8J56DRAFT_243765 [Mycena floridula]
MRCSAILSLFFSITQAAVTILASGFASKSPWLDGKPGSDNIMDLIIDQPMNRLNNNVFHVIWKSHSLMLRQHR